MLRDLDSVRQDMEDQSTTYKGTIAGLSATNARLQQDLRAAREPSAAGGNGGVEGSVAQEQPSGERDALLAPLQQQVAGLAKQLQAVGTRATGGVPA